VCRLMSLYGSREAGCGLLPTPDLHMLDPLEHLHMAQKCKETPYHDKKNMFLYKTLTFL
jgi:hypothetical protein